MALDAQVVGLASDSTDQLSAFRAKHVLPFLMLSDPLLHSAEALDVPISSRTGYTSALAVHPVIRHLPKKAFVQPAFFIFEGQELIYEWRQVEKLRNLFGANGRPSPTQILELTQQTLGRHSS